MKIHSKGLISDRAAEPNFPNAINPFATYACENEPSEAAFASPVWIITKRDEKHDPMVLI